MLIAPKVLRQKYNLRFDTIVHVGASVGEELADYAEHGARRIFWVEPRQEAVKQLRSQINQFPDVDNRIIPQAAGDKAGSALLHISNNGQSSSLLKPGTHLTAYPHITFDYDTVVEVETLDHMAAKAGFANIPVDFLNIDVQGAELSVLRGATDLLANVSAVYCEVNFDALYVDCALFWEISRFLHQHDFICADIQRTGAEWGDALYLASRICHTK